MMYSKIENESGLKVLVGLTAGILLGLGMTTSSYADANSIPLNLNNQTLNSAQSSGGNAQVDLGDPFMAWDDKLKNILAEQLVLAGFDEKVMAEEAAVINAIQDKDEFEKTKLWFYSKYQNLALQGLHRVATLANSAEADKLIINMEQVLQSQPGVPQGSVPVSIPLIYEQIAVSVLALGDSPCLTPMTRLGCLFALLGNRECAYIPPATPPLSSIPAAWRFPSAPVENLSSSHLYPIVSSYWDVASNTNMHQFVSAGNDDGDIIRPAPPIGFKWPLKASDHTMCIEMNISGFNPINEVFSGRVNPEAIGVVDAYVPLPGYLRVSAFWSLTLNGYRTFRAGQPASVCSFHHDAISDTFSDDVDYLIPANPHSRACWFSNLEEVYRNTVMTHPFEANPSDPDTWFAASVDITSGASVGIVEWGTTYGGGSVGITFNNFGILMVRDR